MSREEANQLLLAPEDGEGKQSPDGRYLVRESSRTKGQMTLSMVFNEGIKNYLLYHDDVKAQHYVNEAKLFDTLHDLVADSLIMLFVELHGADYIANLPEQSTYEESPYMTLHRGRLAFSKGGGGGRRPSPQPPIQRKPMPIPSQLQATPQLSSATSAFVAGNQVFMANVSQTPPPPPPLSSLPSNRHGQPGRCLQSDDQLMLNTSASYPAVGKPKRYSQGSRPLIQPLDIHQVGGDGDDAEVIVIDPSEFSSKLSLGSTCSGGSGSDGEGALALGLGGGAVRLSSKERCHSFKTFTFIGNPWCDFCGNFIWGLIGQGVKCEGGCVQGSNRWYRY